nr:hypothetical protein [Megavirus caiporensis]
MANRNSTKSTRVNSTSERNVGNKKPTYQFQMNRSQNEVQEREPNLAERFGHYPVVTSSLSLLISFLLRQLNYMSKRDSKTLGKIVDWSKQSLDGVATQRNALQKLANEVSRCKLNCGAWSSLKCYESESENGDIYCGSSWYSGKNQVPPAVLKSNTVTLVEARADYLLDQICLRLDSASRRLESRANCDYDTTVKDVIDKAFDFYNDLLNRLIGRNAAEFSEFLERLEEFERTRKTHYQNNQYHTDSTNYRPKSYKVVNKKNTVESKNVSEVSGEQKVENVPKPIVIDPKHNKPVKSGFSYSSAAGKTNQVDTEVTKSE